MRVLLLGASGMIGSTVLRVLSESKDFEVYGSIRDEGVRQFFSESVCKHLIAGIDVVNSDVLVRVLDLVQPAVVINCAGLTRHRPEVEDPLVAIPINTLMPHRLAGLCKLIGARLVHVSTDCVFSGEKGSYIETDFADARDVYGKSKAMGEVTSPHTVTLRTSTIGHEFQTKYGLLEWFLSREGRCKGYNRAIFSGLPTVVFAAVLRDVVIPRPELSGLYHVAAQAIDKFDLLNRIAKVYGKQIEIEPDDRLAIDRSLNGERFRNATGYVAPEWDSLINMMHEYR
jgi:dTDP-4-dehydrorhamnose reductase